MTGPDSDGWPADATAEESWDWQSTDICAEAERLLDEGGDDEELLLAVGRYSVENLILNAVHEIGEWLRFDGQRIFPAHLAHPSAPGARDGQGNGGVTLDVAFRPLRQRTELPPDQRPDELDAQRGLRVIREMVGPARFTYLPGTSVQFRTAGPVILRHRAGSSTEWLGDWSPATTEAARSGCDVETVATWVGRDVHRALVASEADRICGAFHIDGRRPWSLAGREPAGEADGVVVLNIDYEPTQAAAAGAPASLPRRGNGLVIAGREDA